MEEDFTFKAIGTIWSIRVDEKSLKDEHKSAIQNYIRNFESHFSRFLPNSEVNQFGEAAAGSYDITEEFAVLLKMADRLRWLTNGVFDPAAAGLLEKAGYDNSYRLKDNGSTASFSLPQWSLDKQTVTLDGPTQFDLGGIGKGYCIDRVADLLIGLGYKNFLVDAGGDIYGTSKVDGSPWTIAIQHPSQPDTAAGTAQLYHQAIAVSDSFRRRWGKWHHIVDPKNNRPIENVVGAVAIAPNAWHADCMTSVLFMAPPEKYPLAATELEASYLVFNKDGTCNKSPTWNNKLFT